MPPDSGAGRFGGGAFLTAPGDGMPGGAGMLKGYL